MHDATANTNAIKNPRSDNSMQTPTARGPPNTTTQHTTTRHMLVLQPRGQHDRAWIRWKDNAMSRFHTTIDVNKSIYFWPVCSPFLVVERKPDTMDHRSVLASDFTRRGLFVSAHLEYFGLL